MISDECADKRVRWPDVDKEEEKPCFTEFASTFYVQTEEDQDSFSPYPHR